MALIDEDVGKALSDELSQQRMRCDAGWGELEDIVMAKDAFSVAAAGAVDELLYFTDRSQIGFEICDLLFEPPRKSRRPVGLSQADMACCSRAR